VVPLHNGPKGMNGFPNSVRAENAGQNRHNAVNKFEKAEL
jgi:hypothetical protein